MNPPDTRIFERHARLCVLLCPAMLKYAPVLSEILGKTMEAGRA